MRYSGPVNGPSSMSKDTGNLGNPMFRFDSALGPS
jgi:hypothetical protein